MVFGGILAGNVQADPADDALAKLNELSRQAEQTTEAMHSAQLDLQEKVAAQQTADAQHAADMAAVDAAETQLATFQNGVDRVAAAQYMGGRTDGLDAMLTADLAAGPHRPARRAAGDGHRDVGADEELQDELSVQATRAEAASAKSAADAKTAAEQAAAVRADLQSKQSKLQVQIAVVKSQYTALTPAQREALAALPPRPHPRGAAAPPPTRCHPVTVAPRSWRPPRWRHRPAGGRGSRARPGSEGMVAVQAALTRIGSPYSWGAAGPGSFDCSGLVMWAFEQAGVSLPHSSQALAQGGQPVSMDQMQPGDLVTYYSDASHVGIYIGDGMMVHASTYGTPVRVAPVDNAPIHNVRRY